MLLCVVVAALSGTVDDHPAAVVGLVGLAVTASLVRGRAVLRWTPVLEAVITTVLVLSTDPLDVALLPYLLAPCLAAGLFSGLPVVITAAGLSALTLLVTRLLGWQTGDVPEYFAQVSQWVVLSFAVGALAAWIRRIQEASFTRPTTTRRTLRPTACCPTFVECLVSCRRARRWASHRSCCSRRVPGRATPGGPCRPTDANERLVVLAQEGRAHTAGHPTPLQDADDGRGSTAGAPAPPSPRRPRWTVRIPATRSWCRSRPRTERSRCSGSSARRHHSNSDAIEIVERLARESALRLDAALLFSDVRTIATAEERRRVARKIHDGIAQELASIGYVVDDLAADGSTPAPGMRSAGYAAS